MDKNNRKMKQRIFQIGSLALGAFALATFAFAQDFKEHRGNAAKTGLPVLAPSTPGLTPPSTYNNVGRGFLRWFDPLQSVRLELDNDQPGTVPTPAAAWDAPGPGQFPIAFNFFQDVIGLPPYRYTTTVASTSTTDPRLGVTATYDWIFSGLTPGREYAVSVNIPIGPTDVDPGPGRDEVFPQRYYVYEISGIVNGPVVDVVDTFASAGGLVRLGNGGQETNAVFVADPAGQIQIRLFNTTPRAGDGSFLDPTADPGNELVYADLAVLSVLNSPLGSARAIATPTVGQLVNPPPGGGPIQFGWRVMHPRVEETFIGDLNRSYNFGVVTSYTYNGDNVFDPTNTGRRNMVWSWPARRPFDNSEEEAVRYSTERRDFIVGADLPGSLSRADQFIQVDNLNAGATVSGGWVSDDSATEHIGPDYLETPAVLGAPTEIVTYAPYLPPANYRIQVWLPSSNPGTFTRSAEYVVRQGGVPVATLILNQTTGGGWVTLPGQPAGGYQSDSAANLTVELLNSTAQAADVGRPVYADAVRFVRQADLSARSTSIMASVTLAGGVQRDVVIVALENGRIYCIDAHGDPITGDPPQIYWTYPSEIPATDPNDDPLQDGKDRIAEMPTNFDLSSAAIANVGGVDLLFISAQNGRVYCIEVAGRGDGTAVRRWTYPDDYNPTTPDSPIAASTLGRLTGSVAYSEEGGQPTVFVPTEEGRLYALDASGDPTSKTTSVLWSYPDAIDPVIGPITSTPNAANGLVYFAAPLTAGSPNGAVYAVDQATGALVWSQTSGPSGDFGRFNLTSGLFVPGAQITGPGGAFVGIDAVFFADVTGRVISFNAATGAVQWETTELLAGAIGSLGFTYMTVFNNFGTLVANVPVVLVPTVDGRITALLCDGSTNNTLVNRRVWSFLLDGNNQVASIATGGWLPADTRSWMYTADSEGILYAFNHDTSLPDSGQQITPGDPPGQDELVENDPRFDQLNDAMDLAEFMLVVPEAYEEIYNLLQAGTLDYAQLDAIATAGEATRRNFEFGETLYVVLYDLPDLPGDVANYIVEFQVSGSQRATERRQVQARLIPSGTPPTGQERLAITAIPMIPTGRGGVVPGTNNLAARLLVPGAGQQIASGQRSLDFDLANPMAPVFLDNVGSVNSSVANTTQLPLTRISLDPNLVGLFGNGNTRTDQTPVTASQPFTNTGPSLSTKGDPVAHGATGVSQLLLRDRSLMTLIYGPTRGLQNVRYLGRDLAWIVPPTNTPALGVYKPLVSNTTELSDFEDEELLSQTPNRSVDYPNIVSDRISVVKEIFGNVENPIFGGVSLNPPAITQVDREAYLTNDPVNGYNAQMQRAMSNTVFDLNVNVPLYQPPIVELVGGAFIPRPYLGSQVVYVDANQPGFANDGSEAFRTFNLFNSVDLDERLTMAIPTVDLGSQPSGGGFNGGAAGGPFAPYVGGTSFSPWNPAFVGGSGSMFQPFGVLNEGNVNLLNVRVAKEFNDSNGFRPVELFAPGLHELSWLDASLHLHSSLDPRFSGTFLEGIDVQGRNVLPKARVGDLAPTRLSVNPVSRANPNIGPGNRPLIEDTVTYTPGDPRIGVSTPIGTPVGDYIRRIYAFEDEGGNQSPDIPSLGPGEAFTDPGLQLRFTVRESRLTNRPTTKAAPNIERSITGDEAFRWENQQPSGFRDAGGNLYVAWSSNRLEVTNDPGWDQRDKVEVDSANQNRWRIYVAGLANSVGQIPGVAQSPIQDLDGWVSANADRWFNRSISAPIPAVNPFVLQPGESLIPDSIRFGSPVFPASGVFNMLDAPSLTGRTGSTRIWMAYIGQATKLDAGGSRSQISQLFATELELNGDGSVVEVQTSALPFNLDANMSRPAIVATPAAVTVFYTLYGTGLGQIYTSTLNLNTGNWSQPRSLGLGEGFESVDAPSVVLRRYRNTGTAKLHLSFTAKVRGRPFSEAFIARLNSNSAGAPQGNNPVEVFGTALEPMIFEPATGTYSASGVQWALQRSDLFVANPNAPYDPSDTFIDVFRLQGGQLVSILDQTTRQYDQGSGVLSYVNRMGGMAYIDTRTGIVRFSGAVIPTNLRLFVRYAPRFLRTSTGPGANYRSSSMVFDDRFLGINVFPGNPQRNRLADLNYWGNAINARPAAADPIRWDRFVIANTRTSGDGSSATRPYFTSYRPGLRLPTAVALDAAGTPLNFQVTFDAAVPVDERFYQIDPGSGRVFFMAGMEDRIASITYIGADESGNVIPGNITIQSSVGITREFLEQAIPIEQVGAESNLVLAINPLNERFNAQFNRGPALYWMFWTSTRGGSPDVYFQSMAPRFAPQPPTP